VTERANEEPRVAVFDWDDTSIFGDVGVATFSHQLDHLALRLAPEDLAELLPESVEGIEELEGGLSLADVRADILEAYAVLWPSIEAGNVERVRGSPEHRSFRAKVGWLYQALEATAGIGPTFAYPWLPTWLAGFTRAEVHEMAMEALEAASGEPPGREEWRSAMPGRAVPLRHVR
jgi:hypothetical protein